MKIVSTRLMGGLGNMMFQIATAYSLSLRDQKKLVCDTNNMVIAHKPYSAYKNNIFRKIEFSESLKINNYIGAGIEYREIPKDNLDVLLVGHFQSEKFFFHHRKEILDLFEPDEESKTYIKEKYNSVLNKDTCSIHVRRGDYLGLQNYHPVLSIEYNLSAIEFLGKNKHFMIFSDDVLWCQENFSFLKNKTYVIGNSDFQDLYLMSFCNNNIIANSTFSWWGAWLNQNENKKVIIPSNWFGPSYAHLKTDDLYCENWVKI